MVRRSGASAGLIQKLVEVLDPGCGARLHGTSRNCIHAAILGPKLVSEIAHRGLKRRLHRTHDVVMIDNFFGAVVGERPQVAPFVQEGLGELRRANKGVARDEH